MGDKAQPQFHFITNQASLARLQVWVALALHQADVKVQSGRRTSGRGMVVSLGRETRPSAASPSNPASLDVSLAVQQTSSRHPLPTPSFPQYAVLDESRLAGKIKIRGHRQSLAAPVSLLLPPPLLLPLLFCSFT